MKEEEYSKNLIVNSKDNDNEDEKFIEIYNKINKKVKTDIKFDDLLIDKNSIKNFLNDHDSNYKIIISNSFYY